ncbi:unnamed protein product, partial [Rotaria magnacalcarata]
DTKIFKSVGELNADQFSTQADDIFNKLKYPDEIRLIKIKENLDETLQS